jgi:hypothetical protein
MDSVTIGGGAHHPHHHEHHPDCLGMAPRASEEIAQAIRDAIMAAAAKFEEEERVRLEHQLDVVERLGHKN